MPEPTNQDPPRPSRAAGDQPDPAPDRTEEPATSTCPVCGKERPADWQCGCGGGDAPGPMVPEGWDPALTRGTGPRLPLVGRQGGRAG